MELTREIRDKRIAVMKDVIAQIESNSYGMTASEGYIVAASYGGRFYGIVNGESTVGYTDLQLIADDFAKECRLCMLGASLLSKARVFDGIPANRYISGFGNPRGIRENIVEDLSDLFDKETLGLMEAAFETCSPGGIVDIDKARRAEKIYRGMAAAERAMAVARNVIENDGEFVV